MSQPAELPEGGEGIPAPPPWIPNVPWWGVRPPTWGFPPPPPNELPAEVLETPILNELVKLRDRIHQVETDLLMARIGGRRPGVGGPAELPPEPQVKAAAFARPLPHEIAEIAEIAEFPIPDSVAQQIAHLIDQRIATLGGQIRAEIDALRQQIAG
jgi:hypothetical protein